MASIHHHVVPTILQTCSYTPHLPRVIFLVLIQPYLLKVLFYHFHAIRNPFVVHKHKELTCAYTKSISAVLFPGLFTSTTLLFITYLGVFIASIYLFHVKFFFYISFPYISHLPLGDTIVIAYADNMPHCSSFIVCNACLEIQKIFHLFLRECIMQICF